MTPSIPPVQAKAALSEAVALAKSEAALPVEWESHARTVFRFDAKTYTPALGTLLLAKAVDAAADTLAIKVTDDPHSYSLRSLGHGVLVPAAVADGFSLRVTGREPLNNQPFFRYEHMSKIDRVQNSKQLQSFLAIARRANSLSSAEALFALAAFVRVAIEEHEKLRTVSINVSGLSADRARIAVEDFLRFDADDRPRRLQGFAAACMDLGHRDVRSRRINDPSRGAPGDVQAYVNDVAILSMEVRGKPVPATELSAYADACAAARIGRAILFVDAPGHAPIDVNRVDSHAVAMGAVQVVLFESAAELVGAALAWADGPLAEVTAHFVQRMLTRLREIEVTKETLDEFARAVTLVQAR